MSTLTPFPTNPVPGAADIVYGGLGPRALAVSWTLFIISTVLMCLRLYVRFGMERRGTWPLIWLTAAYVGAAAATISVTISVRMYGIGNHLPILLSAGTVSRSILSTWITLFFDLSSIGLGKAAAASILISIHGHTGQKAKIFLWTVATLNLILVLIIMIALWFQCDPVHKLWDLTTPGTCHGRTAVLNLGITVGSVNAASDVILALYPSYMIWRLNMSKRLKCLVSVLLGLGVFSGVSAAIKTSKLPGIQVTTDPTYSIAPLVIWGMAEAWIVVIVATVPPTYPLFQSFIQRTRTRSSSRSHSKAQNLGSGNEKDVELNLRGGDTKITKGRSYIDHTDLGRTNEGSAANLPDNCVMMRHEIRHEVAVRRPDTISMSEGGYSSEDMKEDSH